MPGASAKAATKARSARYFSEVRGQKSVGFAVRTSGRLLILVSDQARRDSGQIDRCAARGGDACGWAVADHRWGGVGQDAGDHAAGCAFAVIGDRAQLDSGDHIHQQGGWGDEDAHRGVDGSAAARFWEAGAALADYLHVSFVGAADSAALRRADWVAGE